VSTALASSRLLPADVLRVGASGLRARRMRAALSALGVAIGIASMVAVLGVSESSKADLLAALDRLGTNLLTVGPGQTLAARPPSCPSRRPAWCGGWPRWSRLPPPSWSTRPSDAPT
jgi:putative ABC transport system permease protein